MYQSEPIGIMCEEKYEVLDNMDAVQAAIKEIGEAQVDCHVSDQQPGFEFVLKDRKCIAEYESTWLKRRNCQTQYLTIFDQNLFKNDLIFQIYCKSIQNLENYFNCLFPSEKLLQELGCDVTQFNLEKSLAHFKYLNIARYDSKELLGMAG